MHRSILYCLALLSSTFFGCTLGATLSPTRVLKQRQAPPPSPFLVLTRPTDLTTCTNGVLQWAYTGPDLTMTLQITNVGVPQGAPPASSLPPPRVNSASDDGRVVESLAPGPALSPLPPAGEHVRDLPAVARRSEVSFSKRASFRVTVTYPPDGTFLFTTDETFRVPTVQVPEGWYVMTATVLLEDGGPSDVPTFYRPIATGAFFVRNGTDTSCVITENGAPSPSQSSSSPSSSDSQTASSTSSSESSTESETVSPVVVGAVSSKPINSGAIAGGVVGGLAVLALIIAALLYVRYLQSKSSGYPKTVGGGHIRKRGNRKWGGLGSLDSVSVSGRGESNTVLDVTPVLVRPERRPSGTSAKQRSTHRHQSTSSSLGAMLAQPSLSYQYNPYVESPDSPHDGNSISLDNADHRSSTRSPGLSSSPTSAAYLTSVSPTPARSPSQSPQIRGQFPPYPDPFSGDLRSQTVTSLPASTERRPSASTTHEISRPETSAPYFTVLGNSSSVGDFREETRSRSASNGRKRGSIEVPAQGYAYQMPTRLRENNETVAPIKTTYPPSTSPTTASPVTRGRRVSSTKNPSPITPSTSTGPEPILSNGQGYNSQGRKKAARKPVPSYDATELQSSYSSGPTPASTPPSSVPNTSPLAARLQREKDSMKRQFSASAGNLHSSQIDLTLAAQNPEDSPELQALRHKNSFGIGLPGAGDGGRQVHYLIPDLPPPNRE